MKRTAKKKPASPVTITWLGHSAFHIQSPNGKSLLIDPWLDNPKAPPAAKEIAMLDLIMVSHSHGDHLGNTIELAKRTGATVLAIYELSLYLQSQGVAKAQSVNKGGSFESSGITVTMVDAKHSGDLDVGGNVTAGGEPAGYVVRFENGFTLYHAGDTAVFGDMSIIRDLYRPDAVLLPIGGLFTMGPREAAYACGLLRPRIIIGMHYGTFPILSGTPAELKQYLPAAMKKKVKVLEPGVPATLV